MRLLLAVLRGFGTVLCQSCCDVLSWPRVALRLGLSDVPSCGVAHPVALSTAPTRRVAPSLKGASCRLQVSPVACPSCHTSRRVARRRSRSWACHSRRPIIGRESCPVVPSSCDRPCDQNLLQFAWSPVSVPLVICPSVFRRLHACVPLHASVCACVLCICVCVCCVFACAFVSVLCHVLLSSFAPFLSRFTRFFGGVQFLSACRG